MSTVLPPHPRERHLERRLQLSLKVQKSILVTARDQFTSAYERTETNHTGTCPPNRPDGCVTSFNWDLRKQ
jgi:hypothetical protein